MLVNGFAVLGILCISIAPMFVENFDDLPPKVVLFRYMFPVIIMGFFIALADSFRQMKGTSQRIKQMTDFSKGIAAKEYRLGDVEEEVFNNFNEQLDREVDFENQKLYM